MSLGTCPVRRGAPADPAPRARRGGPGGDVRRALAAALAVLAVLALAAAVTAIGFAAAAREALDFGFGGVAPRLGEAEAIFLHNARLMGAIAAAVLVVQVPRFERDDRALGRGGERLRTAADVALAVAVAVNAAFIGVTVGAYGGQMVAAMLPHGPLELAAYAVALSLYARARVAPLPVRPALLLAGSALALLALAALAETFATG